MSLALMGAGRALDAAASAPASYDSTVDTDTPLAHWKLGEVSGNFIDRIAAKVLTPAGTVVYAQPGLITGADTAVDFNNGRALRANSTEFALTTAFSVEAWVKPASIGVQQSIVFKGDNATYWTWGLEIVAANAFEFWVNGRGPFAQGGTAVAGTIYHVVGTYDAANIRTYVNGVLVGGPTAATVAIGTPENAAALQVSGRTTAMPFKGVIDEVAYYPSALSLARVQAHYNAGTGAPVGGPLAADTSLQANTSLNAGGVA